MMLKEIRLISGLKAFKVVEILEISRTQLYNLEKGKYIFDLNKIERLNKTYNRTYLEIRQAAKGVRNE